ncbi:hypothetical protein ACS0TY_005083 [Phlomoides rotata]
MEQSDEVETYKPLSFCTKLLSLEADILSTCIVSLVSPFLSVISLVSDLIFRRSPERKEAAGNLLLGRIAVGLLAAAYVCMVLVVLMIVAGVVGVVLVRAWMEEPICVRESLQFDYTDAHPTALFSFGNRAVVPPAHTLYVSLLLLMPDSDYNRDVGIFQLSAELISFQGNVIKKASHPSMLVFRSWPIRYTRTFLMGVPLLLGITTETQRITFPILKHKEAAGTEHVRITLFPRAGTSALPQFYGAQVVVRSRPPWTKELVYNWKLTFCVWTTMSIFMMFVSVVVFFLKPLISPVMTRNSEDVHQEVVGGSGRELGESLKRWQRSRSKRRAFLHGESSVCSSSASSITVSHGEADCGDSESVCS